eukprot:TRINITY_DN19268_c0_g1_i1.p1 TRINITY_DN19268_c0_g1~~TRINITY_DN19268_c0_g1_i1.p1  ORF type:complete len:588 (-),score=91.66 TRINITY_DN19268_c0_g1_i1:664-2427(-)
MSSDDEMDYGNSSDYENDSEVGYDDYGFDLSQDDEPRSKLPQASYVILSDNDIQERQSKEIESVMAILSVSAVEAGILLRHFKWSAIKVNEEWFQDEDRVRNDVGLLLKRQDQLRDAKQRLTCNICFEDFTLDSMKAAACGHFFCNECWTGYIKNAISEGPGCLGLRCPLPACNAAVGEDMVLGLASEEHRMKYLRYLLRSYVEDSRKTKWCPGPGCEYAVELDVSFSSSYDIVCKCGYNFCWHCLADAHRPVDCQTVTEWMQKNSTEAENTNWILANSKPCPKCKRPIEKNQGCMHMSCSPPCKFEFCWLCLGAWSEHGERTGGFYACNRYETAKQEGVYDETERRREMAKNSLEKYTHFYERWNANEHSRLKALENLKDMQAEKMEMLSDKQCQPVSQLKFVMEAWLQIVECRRVLKWTYAYGYYLREDEAAKRQFFEYLQGEAESGLERLHNCAEKELSTYLNPPGTAGEPPAVPFNDFRTKLAGLTSVTRTYFENLVKALENNLADVKEDGSSKGSHKSKNFFEGSSSRPPKGKGKGKSGSASASRRPATDEAAHWSCEACTFANQMNVNACAMCGGARPQGV